MNGQSFYSNEVIAQVCFLGAEGFTFWIAEIVASYPPDISGYFEIDPSYAYAIGLHAVVDEPTLDRAAIERCIERFRKLGEREWRSACQAAASLPRR